MSQEGIYTLYGRPGSGSSAVEAMLALTGLAHEIVYFQKRADGGLPPEILEINPLGQVPALRLPDGAVMTESAAILLYLAETEQGRKFAPTPGSPERAAFLRLMVFMAANTYMTDLRYYYPERYAGGTDQAAEVKAKALEEQTRNWSALEAMAQNGDALLASGFSVADIYLAMLVSWSQIDGFHAKWPKLHAIAKSIAQMQELAEIWHRNDVTF